MKLIEALKKVQEDLKTALDRSRARNGDDLTITELKKLKADTPVYWINRATIADTARPIFVAVKIPSGPNPIGKADNNVAFRSARAYIDVVTLKSSTDPKLLNFLESIERNITELGYSFEQNREAELDSQSGRTTWSFQISRTL